MPRALAALALPYSPAGRSRVGTLAASVPGRVMQVRGDMIMHSLWLPTVGLALTLATILASGCGSGGPTLDTAAFEVAVNAYLRAQSMDMKAGRFRALEVTGDRAVGTVSLTHAEGAAGVSVQWEFDFARRHGAWVVSSCRRR